MKKIIFFLTGLLFLVSCEIGEVPILGTIVIDETTPTDITLHVDVETGEITDCGIYYGTSKVRVTNGTSDQVKGECSGTSIQGKITGLTPNKEYYLKVYGMNELGRCETEVVKVKTSPRTPSIDDNKHPQTQP